MYKIELPFPHTPMWSHLTPEDHNLDTVESTQSVDTFTKVKAFLGIWL